MKRLIVKKDLYQSVKDDEKFLEAIQLCMILSAIQYNNVIYAMLIENEEFDTYLKLHLVIYHASFLYEGIKKFNTIRNRWKELEDLESFEKNKEIIEDNFGENNSFFTDVLYYIRRKVAIHFDRHVVVRKFEEFLNESKRENEDVVFIESKTDINKDMKFSLANNLNFRYILGLITDKSYKEKFKTLALELTKLSKLFCDTIQEIIPELIQDYCVLIEQEN